MDPPRVRAKQQKGQAVGFPAASYSELWPVRGTWTAGLRQRSPVQALASSASSSLTMSTAHCLHSPLLAFAPSCRLSLYLQPFPVLFHTEWSLGYELEPFGCAVPPPTGGTSWKPHSGMGAVAGLREVLKLGGRSLKVPSAGWTAGLNGRGGGKLEHPREEEC